VFEFFGLTMNDTGIDAFLDEVAFPEPMGSNDCCGGLPSGGCESEAGTFSADPSANPLPL
jgi:hypothetical protein